LNAAILPGSGSSPRRWLADVIGDDSHERFVREDCDASALSPGRRAERMACGTI